MSTSPDAIGARDTGSIYCGPAPTPEDISGAWNLDVPALLLCVGVVVVWRRRGTGRPGALAVAVIVLAILFFSPLCALTAALFSARVAHHLLLVAVVAALIAWAMPMSRRGRISIGWIAALHAIVLWTWHVPEVYALAIADPFGYWAMQLSLLGTACWFWMRVLDGREHAGPALLALLGTIIQMGMLGALLTFAARPLYASHLDTTSPFGLSALQDQQLAGILMWVPAALPYLAAALIRLRPMLGPSRGTPTWSG